MIRRTIVLIGLMSLLRPMYGTQVDLQAQVAQQVDHIRSISGSSESSFFELPGTSLPAGKSPIDGLISLGMDAIPYLIPYLSDGSLTKAYRYHSSGVKSAARVNEYILLVIVRITGYEFDLPPGWDFRFPQGSVY